MKTQTRAMFMEAARDYVTRGWEILPVHYAVGEKCSCGNAQCKSPGKHPRTKNGLKDATTDKEQIDKWWSEGGDGHGSELCANIGIRTGPQSGIFVVDIDVRHGGDKSLLDLLEKYGDMPKTVEADTGGGGSHLYYLYPPSEVKNSVGLCPGIDIRGNNAYVVAPPSNHISGGQYKWRNGPSETDIAPAPQWLLTLIQSQQSRKSKKCLTGDDHGIFPEGSRHNTLLSLAGSMRQRGMSEDAIYAALQAENLAKCSPPLGDNEVAAIAKSIGRYEPRPLTPTQLADLINSNNLPDVCLPGGVITISNTAEKLGTLLGEEGQYYVKDRIILQLKKANGTRSLELIKMPSFPTIFERVANLKIIKSSKTGPRVIPTICNETMAKCIVASDSFVDKLRQVAIVSPCAVLTERSDGTLKTVCDYDDESHILAAGSPPEDMYLGDARTLISELLADFLFASEGDRSRAIAAMFTPALVFGRLLGGRSPIDVGEADASQSGKGYRNRLTAAIYNTSIHTVVQKKSGVGGMEEDISGALIASKPFISIDNCRNRIDLPSVESMLTEDWWPARVPYYGTVMVDPTRTIFMLTSNGVEFTTDLANRSSITRIRKQVTNYRFKTYGKDKDLLTHVKLNPVPYLGAIFRIIREWHHLGKPRSDPGGFHDFRAWAGTLAYIVQNLLGKAPLLEGHQDVCRRTSNVNLNFVRDVCVAICKAGSMNKWMRVHSILDILIADGSIQIPSVGQSDDLDDVVVRDRALMAIGRKLKKAMEGVNSISKVDGVLIEHREATDSGYRPVQEYCFSQE